ncbi:MAG: glycosyltransferase, partial [Halioglobus sp.]|nr:glycosyltransferase [Halioglobus sp.]
MKVLHVYRTYFPDSQGGVQEAIRQIARSTLAHGVENRVFTLSEEPVPAQIQSDEAGIVRVKQHFEIASCGFALSGLNEFRRQTEWADIVHYHYPWPYGDLLHLMAGSPGPSVVTYHSDIVRQQFLSFVYRPVMDRFLGSMDSIIATSPNYAATSKTLERFSSRIDIVPIGLEEASYPDPDQDFIDRVAADYGRDFFLFIGVWRYYKGLHILLKAMQGSSSRVVVVGSGPI